MRVLVTGGTGYLGQFILEKLSQRPDVDLLYTYSNPSQPSSLTVHGKTVPGFKVDFASGEGLEAVFGTCSNAEKVDVVINTAAWSQPVACEKDEAGAHAVNVPKHLISHILAHHDRTFLLHISTDHCYEGLKPMWDETDPWEPVNAYGRSKVAGDRYVLDHYPADRAVIVRPSMIIGPAPPLQPVGRGLFLQWLDGQLTKGEMTNLFTNELRTPTYVHDLVRVVEALVDLSRNAAKFGSIFNATSEDRVLNVGVPERLSRYEMGLEICKLRGLDPQLANSIVRPEGVPTPLDISMKSARVERVLGLRMTHFAAALKAILGV